MPLRCVRIRVYLRNLRLVLLPLLLTANLYSAEIVEVRKIWDQAPHSAFTSLAQVRHGGPIFDVFERVPARKVLSHQQRICENAM